MADIEATISSEAPAATTPTAKSPKVKKVKAAVVGGGVKKPKTKPNHPPTSEMVQSAIKALKERGGSSLQAIKKYISATYKIDADKLSPFIKKYLKGAVTGGQLVQTKGKGASGSFKISAALKPKPLKKASGTGGDKPKAAATKKAPSKKATSGVDKKSKSVAKKMIAAGAKKTAAVKKPASDKKKAAVATAKSAKKTGVKSAPKQKPTKPKADSVKKPKTPKPKKAALIKKSAAKK